MAREKVLKRPALGVRKRWMAPVGPLRGVLWPSRWEAEEEGKQRTTSRTRSGLVDYACGVRLAQRLGDPQVLYIC